MPVDWIHSAINLLYFSVWLLIAQFAIRRRRSPTPTDIGLFNHRI